MIRRAAEEAGPDPPDGHQRTRFELTHMVSRRLDVGRGYTRRSDSSSAYAGDPYRLLTDAALRVGSRISIRAAAEKDPGEKFRLPGKGRSASLDFTTASLSVSGIGPLEAIIAGDFVVHWAWGLLLGRSSFGLLSRPLRPRRSGIAPFRGMSESGFYRGIALSAGRPDRWQLAAFASRRLVDAAEDTTAGEPGTRTFTLTSAGGLHRTQTEIARRRAIGMSTAGGLVTFRVGAVTAGVAAYGLRLSETVRRGDRPDQRNDFTGSTQWGGSGSLTIRTDRFHHSTELALVDGRWAGIVMGNTLTVSKAWTLWSYHRSLSSAAQSLIGSVPRRGGARLSQEGGINFGVRHHISRGTSAWLSYDHHWFNGLRFNTSLPSAGRRFDLTVRRRWNFNEVLARAGYNRSETSVRVLDERGSLIKASRRAETWRCSALLRIRRRDHSGLSFRYVSTKTRKGVVAWHYGHLLAVDIRLGSSRRWELRGHLALFDSDSGDSRIYTYEAGLSHEFSIPSYSGSGDRWFVMASIRVSKTLRARVKYARTRWPGESSSGTGLDEVPGDRLRSVAADLHLTL